MLGLNIYYHQKPLAPKLKGNSESTFASPAAKLAYETWPKQIVRPWLFKYVIKTLSDSMWKFLDNSAILESTRFDLSEQMLRFMAEGTLLKFVLTVAKEFKIQDIFQWWILRFLSLRSFFEMLDSRITQNSSL